VIVARKNRRAPETPETVRMPQSAAPTWALTAGFDVRRVTGDKPYRCPGCDHLIRPGLWHLVVVPQDVPDERRHWHERCWQTELRSGRR
jgi:hypothetical protein